MVFSIILVSIIFFLIHHIYYWEARKTQLPPRFMAHRGIKTHSPENTIASFKDAVQFGFSGIELDLVSTKDKQLVCSHNFDLERETNGVGYINNEFYDNIINIKTGVYSHPNNTQNIPSFQNVIDAIPDNIFLNIEIKTFKLFDLSTAKVLGKMITEHKIHHPFMISSFNPIVIAYFKMLYPDVSIGFLLQNPEWAWVMHIIHPDYLHLRCDLISDEFLDLCHQHKLLINLWTVNSKSGIKWCNRQKKVNSIITDNSSAPSY
mgnify:FL=1